MTAESPAIRTVESEADIQAVAALARSIWAAYYTPIIGTSAVEYMLGKFQSETAITSQIADDGYLYYLCSIDGTNAGYLAIVPDQASGRLLLSKIYVISSIRNTGIGRAMLQHAQDYARANGLHTIWLTVNKNNSDSLHAYEHWGFLRTAETVQDIGSGYVMDDFVFAKSV